ncbi:MAG: hypothetical protein RI894_1215 [Bacteroidota bacterium]
MNRIKIQNFGPIQAGYQENGGFMEVCKVTVFIGNQGSGKSTVAKVIATLSWIEKAMVKGVLSENELNSSPNHFVKQLSYQRISSYLKDDTVIEYCGNAFLFIYENGHFTAKKTNKNGYLLPKIMYIPAERNFLSVVDRPDKLKNLPAALYTFNDEYDAAKRLYAKGIELPINNVHFEYDKLNQLAHIVSAKTRYKLRLSEASSGFQSTVPLFLVTKYLSDSLQREQSQGIKENSLEEEKKLEKEIKSILMDTQITTEVRQAYLRHLSAKRKPVCFLNIVEEPEQNLFPISQKNILNELLKYANATDANMLILTTHSPYIINFLSIAIQGAYLKQKIDNSYGQKAFLEKINAIIPLESVVKAADTVIYELDENTGSIKKLETYAGIPSDKNYLNNILHEGNLLFDSLLEIEELL